MGKETFEEWRERIVEKAREALEQLWLRALDACDDITGERGEATAWRDIIKAALLAKQPEGIVVKFAQVSQSYYDATYPPGVLDGCDESYRSWSIERLTLLGITSPGRYRIFPAVRVDEPEPATPTRAQTLREASEFLRCHGACDLADKVREIAGEEASG